MLNSSKQEAYNLYQWYYEFLLPLIKSPVNCSQLLTEFLFNLSLSSPCGSAVHSSKVIYIKVIFEYKSYLYTVYTHNIYDQFKIISVCYWEVNLLHGLICFYTLLYRSVHAFTHVCIYHMYINRILNFFNSWGFF